VDVVFAQLGQNSRGGGEVLVVVRDDEPVVDGRRADEPVDDGQALVPAALGEPVLGRVDPRPCGLGHGHVGEEIGEHVGHRVVLVEVPSGPTELGTLRWARAHGPVVQLMPPRVVERAIPLEPPGRCRVGQVEDHRQAVPFSAS